LDRNVVPGSTKYVDQSQEHALGEIKMTLCWCAFVFQALLANYRNFHWSLLVTTELQP